MTLGQGDTIVFTVDDREVGRAVIPGSEQFTHPSTSVLTINLSGKAIAQAIAPQLKAPERSSEEIIGVTVFGKMPYEGGRRQVGMKANGETIWGPPERKGSLSPEHKPAAVRSAKGRRRGKKK